VQCSYLAFSLKKRSWQFPPKLKIKDKYANQNSIQNNPAHTVSSLGKCCFIIILKLAMTIAQRVVFPLHFRGLLRNVFQKSNCFVLFVVLHFATLESQEKCLLDTICFI